MFSMTRAYAWFVDNHNQYQISLFFTISKISCSKYITRYFSPKSFQLQSKAQSCGPFTHPGFLTNFCLPVGHYNLSVHISREKQFFNTITRSIKISSESLLSDSRIRVRVRVLKMYNIACEMSIDIHRPFSHVRYWYSFRTPCGPATLSVAPAQSFNRLCF